MKKVAVAGCTGYTGKKLVQFLSAHPGVERVELYSYASAGQSFLSQAPELVGLVPDGIIGSVESMGTDADVYFFALPHGKAAELAPALIESGKVVIDLSGDFRLDEPAAYGTWYHFEHPAPGFLGKKDYALADWDTQDPSTALISNPGCYPTATLLSVLPVINSMSDNILAISTVAYSGTSGAGKSANADLLLSEMDGNVRAYNLHHHRHEPEIAQQMGKSGFHGLFSFSVHLLPVSVGMYATTTIFTKTRVHHSDVKKFFSDAYAHQSFIRLRDVPPQIKWVTGTNFADIHISVKDHSIIITTAIDNLIKGAAGQAIQNMNRYFGWPVTLGLLNSESNHVPVY